MAAGENINNLALNEERQVRPLQETILNQFYKKKRSND